MAVRSTSRWRALAIGSFAAFCSLKAQPAPRQALVVQSCEAVFDGRKVMDVPSGIQLVILGEQEGTELVLVRIPQNGGSEITGLIPSSAIVPLAEKEIRREDAGEAEHAPINFDPRRKTSAVDLAEFFKTNRGDFKRWEGQSLNVDGVVEAIRVTGSKGSVLTAEITLRTRSDLPKIRLMVHASEFMDSKQSDQPELRVQDKTLEGRSRDRTYTYRYWYYSNGYWRSRSDAKTEWVPIISVGHPIKANGVLSKYHIHLDLTGATIDKS
jgi:hypothetical protein